MCLKDPRTRFVVTTLFIAAGLLAFGYGLKFVGLVALVAWWVVALVGYIKARPARAMAMPKVPARAVRKKAKPKKKAVKKKKAKPKKKKVVKKNKAKPKKKVRRK